MADPADAYGLTPAGHVRVEDGRFVALDTEPWLDVDGIDLNRVAGFFVELTYRASLLDDPCRPIIRFHLEDGRYVDRIAAAPIAGAGIWIGRIPPGTIRIAVSPTHRLGPFGFVIEGCRVRAWSALVRDGLRGNVRRARNAVLARFIGWRPESDNDLAWAIGATPFSAYERWLARRRRQLDLAGLDRPRHDWTNSAPILLVIISGERTGSPSDDPMGDPKAMARTLDSLRAQAFPRWQAVLVDVPEAPGGDARFMSTDVAGAVDHLGRIADDVLVGVIVAGDRLPDYGLACLAEQRDREPGVSVFYGDETAGARPVLKPGWSPRLYASGPYLGRAVFARGLGAWSPDERRRFILGHQLPSSLAGSQTGVRPVRRCLLETSRTSPRIAIQAASPPVRNDRAALIVLTRDHPALLRRLVASIRARTPTGRYRLVIVDNGDPDGPARDVLAEMASRPEVLLLQRRGPFDFSAFCNDAVAACEEDILVFLNDDMEILSDGWLDRMVAHVLDPAIGAVGAKLTFPDGRLQHVGVVIGMAGGAGHFGAGAAGDDPGWAGRNAVMHDVSAVTGACLAVAREKFAAVGGFDAEHLPIELSDIDLCLKLNARGWQTVIDPHVHLLHEESASRGGATFRRLDVYERQRAMFVERWRHVLRDDPAFHPGLSLYSMEAALG